MDKTKKEQAEKLQIKLDKLLQSKEKKQAAFDKAKQELNAVSKNIDGVKLKLFEILQSGSDDTAFSNWAKRKIGENENHENSNAENAESVKNENATFENSQKPVSQNHQSQPSQNHQQHKGQNQNQPQQQNQSRQQ
jgi:hypothetical protein